MLLVGAWCLVMGCALVGTWLQQHFILNGATYFFTPHIALASQYHDMISLLSMLGVLNLLEYHMMLELRA